MNPPRESDWLSAPGEYQDLVSALSASDPRLRSRYKKNLAQDIQWPNPRAKLVVLEADSNEVFGEPAKHDPPSLKAYLETRAQSPDVADLRRVFILEGIHPDFVAVLGAHFKMHPSFFVEHERVVLFEECDTIVLPATTKMRQHYTMKYFELTRLPQSVQGNFTMCCAVTGRHIGVTRAKGKFLDVGVLRRKCSIWRQASLAGSGWDCLILTDPPLQAIQLPRGNTAVDVALSKRMFHYQNGYPDFMPHSAQMAALAGPPRSSMLDDLCFYLQQHSSRLSSGLRSGPDSVAVFAQKIVAAHYLQLFQFMRYIVSTVRGQLSSQNYISPGYYETAFAEAQWGDTQAVERRMSEYCEDLDAIMLQCCIPLEGRPDAARCAATADSFVSPPGHPAWDSCTAEFQELRLRLQDVRRRAELLNAAITALASISGNRQALRETQSTKALTVVGLFFIPLAYTATLFSMTEPYGPGQERFWVYFAISLPLILCVLGMYKLVDGYDLRLGWLLIWVVPCQRFLKRLSSV